MCRVGVPTFKKRGMASKLLLVSFQNIFVPVVKKCCDRDMCLVFWWYQDIIFKSSNIKSFLSYNTHSVNTLDDWKFWCFLSIKFFCHYSMEPGTNLYNTKHIKPNFVSSYFHNKIKYSLTGGGLPKNLARPLLKFATSKKFI